MNASTVGAGIAVVVRASLRSDIKERIQGPAHSRLTSGFGLVTCRGH